MDELIQWLCSIHPLTPECVSYLRHIIRYRRIKKDQLLLRPGEICENIYFIQKGILRCYYMKNDVDVTDWFFWETDTVVAIDSFYDQTPGEDYIEALEDGELYYISFAELNYLFHHYMEFNFIGRVLTNKYLRSWHRQARNLRRLTAEEKYRFLLAGQPEALLRVPARALASFLDMAPETISRLRGRRIS
jgi:CRP-like cAMP-binding protein